MSGQPNHQKKMLAQVSTNLRNVANQQYQHSKYQPHITLAENHNDMNSIVKQLLGFGNKTTWLELEKNIMHCPKIRM